MQTGIATMEKESGRIQGGEVIVHFDKDKRKDLVFTIAVDKNSHIEILIDQQQPPCGDFKLVGHYSVPVPEELSEDKIFSIKQ